MVALVVILSIVMFVTLDGVVRVWLRHASEKRKRAERSAALDAGLKLVFADEAKSLKRVEVENPKCRILAVDDEEIVLASLRKILVLAGYSLDTVETGPEALTLLQKHDYDFVFTDLKMPVMDGVEVVKAVKHLKPQVDVIVVTGYATIESAVATMKLGAMDYVQKPFTEDELVALVEKFVIRREDRRDRERRPQVHLVTPSVQPSPSSREFNVLSGIFISPWHSWISIEPNGLVRIGLDDFAQKTLGRVDGIILPPEDSRVSAGGPLFTVTQGANTVQILSPVSGKVKNVNFSLASSPALLNESPYESGWVCQLEPASLPADLGGLRIGANALEWYRQEIDRYLADHKPSEDGGRPEMPWDAFAERFLSKRTAAEV